MALSWLVCGVGNIHIVGPCSKCYETQGGLLLGTVATTFRGRVTATCLSCGNTVDYYVEAHEEKIWILEPVEAKGLRAVGVTK